MTGRLISHGRYELAMPWPEGCFVQGSRMGLVVGGATRTFTGAFIEAFPQDPPTFLRGQGTDFAAAETAAWTQYQRILACPGHDYDARGYRNGAGFCRQCGLFTSHVFDIRIVGYPCAACGVGCEISRGGQWFCPEHDPDPGYEDRLLAEMQSIDPADMDQAIGEVLTALAGAAATDWTTDSEDGPNG